MVYKPNYNWGAPSCGDSFNGKMIIFRTIIDSFYGKVGVWLKPLGFLLFGSRI
jgi:hypothetical protein